jgi:DNA-binding response OmpR family regulator
MATKKRILLVEDDLILGESLKELLEYENFNVTWAKDGNEALSITYSNQYDIYIFDIDIPYISGFELLQNLRDSGDDTPCIFLTAKVDIESLTKGFDIGADDYIKKPFDIDELIIRIHTQIKKAFKTHNEIIKYNNISYNIDTNIVTKDDKEIFLSPSELKLFELFIKNIDKTISKEDLLYHIHHGDEGSEATLRVQISKLKKIGLNIANKRAIGYKLETI